MSVSHNDAAGVQAAPPTTGVSGSADPPVPEPGIDPRGRRPTRISSLHVGLIAGSVILVLLTVFLIQNAHTVQVSFLGLHLRVSLAVAMLIAALAGALITGVVGAARIAQLRRSMRASARLQR